MFRASESFPRDTGEVHRATRLRGGGERRAGSRRGSVFRSQEAASSSNLVRCDNSRYNGPAIRDVLRDLLGGLFQIGAGLPAPPVLRHSVEYAALLEQPNFYDPHRAPCILEKMENVSLATPGIRWEQPTP